MFDLIAIKGGSKKFVQVMWTIMKQQQNSNKERNGNQKSNPNPNTPQHTHMQRIIREFWLHGYLS